MSFQQRVVRTKKFMKAYDRYKPISNPWTDRTYLLRNSLWSLDSLMLSLTERNYLDTRWQALENFLLSKSSSELILKMEIAKCSMTFQPIDYIALMIGFSQMSVSEYLFDPEVLIKAIDSTEVFDATIKNPKCLKILLKILSHDKKHYTHGNPDDLKKVIAHVLTKFPDLKKQNFMFTKTKNGLKQKFSEKDIEENF